MNEYYFIQWEGPGKKADNWITVYAKSHAEAVDSYKQFLYDWHHINSTPTWSKEFMTMIYSGGELGYIDTDLWVRLPKGF